MKIFDNFFKKQPEITPIQEPVKTNKQPKQYKNYIGGEVNSKNINFLLTTMSADEIILRYHQVLVSRSLTLTMSDPHANKYLNLLTANVLSNNNGFRLVSQALDNNNSLDDQANKAIEEAWKDWGKYGADVEGKLTFLEMQRLALISVAREGECIIRKIKNKGINKYGYSLQLIDSRRLNFQKYSTEIDGVGNFWKFGIQYDQYNRPLAYSILPNYLVGYAMSGVEEIIPADEIIHLYIPMYIGQRRGLPFYSPILSQMQMLNGFYEASLANARSSSCNLGFIKSPDVEDDIDSEDQEQEITIEGTPASFVQLPNGFEVQQFKGDYPNNEFAPFANSMLKAISSGLNVSYSSLSGDMSEQNYSSLRQSALEERDQWQMLQEWFKNTFVEKIYADWLPYALLNKQIKLINKNNIPVSLTAEKLDKYKVHRFISRKWQWVDPQKEVNAAIASNAAGIRSLSSIIQEQGLDPHEVWLQMEQEQQFLKDHNIIVQDVGAVSMGIEQSKMPVNNEDPPAKKKGNSNNGK